MVEGITKDINEMTKEEFAAIPFVEWREVVAGFDSLVILPNEEVHDSDFRCMSFIACKGGMAICQIGGGSDVIHIDGIGGLGENWLRKHGSVPRLVPPSGWRIDCLKVSGLLRLFTQGELTAGDALSSFEIFSNQNQKP
jgi:hypothetical protein